MKELNRNFPGTNKISVQEISLPKGGGAQRGIGDAFQPVGFSGTGGYSIPIPVTPSRGFEPQLSLQYNSGAGNSEFGLGFSLTGMGISVNTDKGVPRYDGTDRYLLAGVGELAAGKLTTGGGSDWHIRQYFPRIEGTFAKIEQWINKTTGISFWMVTTRNNDVTVYGKTENARIANPLDSTQVYEWLPEESSDAKGNKIVYTYKAENIDNVPAEIYEVDRSFTANRYISGIKYGNYFDPSGIVQFGFELVFDYGEYDLSDLHQKNCDPYVPVRQWACRPDPFSSYRSGFEIRVYRLCRNILLFHHFTGQLGKPCLVRKTGLYYQHEQEYDPVRLTTMSLLNKVLSAGYRRREDGSYAEGTLPPLEFSYSSFSPKEYPRFGMLEMPTGNIPGYLDSAQFLPVDLHGEGLPGFLFSNNDTVLFLEPLGEGKYKAPMDCDPFPINRNIQGGTAALGDLDGNGQLEMLVTNGIQAGFYPYSSDEQWGRFQSFETFPANITDPSLEMSDMDANGRSNYVLVTDSEILSYASLGERGYSPAKRTENEYGFPEKPIGAAKELVGFANILGDGLSHRVRIRAGSVECWPCLGYGRYGKKIQLGNAPDFGNNLSSKRLFLADIDGSGPVDLIYVHTTHVEVYLNQNGNSFSAPISIVLPEECSEIDQISFADISGNGTTCLVFTKISPAPRHYFYDFTGETRSDAGEPPASMKPYLLNEIDNNAGSVTRIQYCSSTKFLLEDKLAGRPWVTKLRFPVQVVEKMTVLDKISGSRMVSTFKYHDGYYDPVEREFRGFGLVESRDTETMPEYGDSLQGQPLRSERPVEEIYVPPVYTRTWYHTGAFLEYDAILRQYREEYYHGDAEALEFPSSVFAPAIWRSDADVVRQAFVSLKGHMMRKEIFAEDNRPESVNPYTVEESNYEVVLIRDPEADGYAVFGVNPRETISYNYERDPKDPMVQQTFVLDVDQRCGEVTKGCSIFLPRRLVISGDMVHYPEQEGIKALASTSCYFNSPDDASFWLRGVPYLQQEFEVSGLHPGAGAMYFSYEDAKEQVLNALQNKIPYRRTMPNDDLQAMQLSRDSVYFWDEALAGPLSLGEVSGRALLHHVESAAYTKDNIQEIFGDKLDDGTIENEGGYFFDPATGYWINKGLVQYYFDIPAGFFLPCGTENSYADPVSSLFQKSTVAYDVCYLRPVGTKQWLDSTEVNEVSGELDYQVMQLRQLVDINKNVSQMLFDALGQVVVSSLFGKENDEPTGGMRLYEYLGQPAEYIRRETDESGQPISFEDVLNNSGYYLQGAASYFFYDLHAQPLSYIELLRENYYHVGGGISPFSCQKSVGYTDGFGRSIGKMQEADPETVISDVERDKADPGERWIVSGRIVYNNKGMPCEEWYPSFTDTPYYQIQRDRIGMEPPLPPTITHYDPLSRIIRVDSPKGFFSKIEFTSWEVIHSDQDDTIMDSSYYIWFMDHYPADPTQEQIDEKDALDKAALFFRTPAIKVMDNAGKVFLHIETLPDDKRQVSYQRTDMQNRVLESIDARLYDSNLIKGTSYYNFRYWYAMEEKDPCRTESVDAGTASLFKNIFGKPIRNFSARDFITRMSYDRLQRPLQSTVTEMVVESFIYGETVLNGDQYNLRGQIYKCFDQAGISTSGRYSLQGAAISTTRQLSVDYTDTLDWKDPAKVPVEPDQFSFTYSFDALGLLTEETTPDGSVLIKTYNRTGLLASVAVVDKDGEKQLLVNSIDYTASLQRNMVILGNGTVSRYAYEPATRRLHTLYSTRPGPVPEDNVLQNIRYVYDPIGNITRTWDRTWQTVFCSNQQVDPLSDYTYDARYQLIQASGRQHQGINKDTHVNGFKQSIYGDICPPDINDETKLENYSEYFTYDPGGNLIYKKHVALSSSWTQETAVMDNSNRLKDQEYDLAGNLQFLQLNNAAPLFWDYRNKLRSAGIIQRPDAEDDMDYYNYDVGGNRVRKVSERMAFGGAVIQVEEKITIGGYEVKRIKTKSISGETIILDRRGLRVMDDTTCIAILLHWITDSLQRETDQAPNSQLRYQMINNQGSVALETDKDAQIISYEEYLPYGGTAIIAGRNRQEVEWKEYRYSGKECDDTTGLYYYGARYYISWLGRWLNADAAGAVDGLNLFAFVKGNPVSAIDPDGRWGWLIAIGVGVLATGYTAYQIASARGQTGLSLAASTIGGAVLGGVTSGVGTAIAASGVTLSQTVSMAVTSTATTTALNYFSGGQVDKTTSVGVASYNWSKGQFGYLFKSGNTRSENFSYAAGLSANVTDSVTLYKGGGGVNVDLVTEFDLKATIGGDRDYIGHSAIVNPAESIDISVGPRGGGFFPKYETVVNQVKKLFVDVPGVRWPNYYGTEAGWSVPIYNVHKDTLLEISSNIASNKDALGDPLLYNGLANSCVGHTSHALRQVGIPNIGLHPFILQGQLLSRQVGIAANPFLSLGKTANRPQELEHVHTV